MNETAVPLLDLQAQYASIRDEIEAAIARVVRSQVFIGGEEVRALEAEIAALCGTRFAVGCASGSDAILLALRALGVGPGDEVICPAYTFFSTAGSVARLGAKPVFADIDPITFNVDPDSVRGAARRCRRLKALIPVHLYGRTADMEALLEIGAALGVPIIEDAAQAIGARDEQGRPAGSRGRAACFSFYPTKNLGGYGDGGMVTTNDASLAERVRVLGNHGEGPRGRYRSVGLASRLDAIQAAVLRAKLAHLERWNRARAANAARYDEALAAAGGADGLSLRTPAPVTAPAVHIYHQYVIRVPAAVRDDVREHLARMKIGTGIYYPVPLHLQECFGGLGYAEGDLPHSEAAARETLALPVYPELSRRQQQRVVDAVTESLARCSHAIET